MTETHPNFRVKHERDGFIAQYRADNLEDWRSLPEPFGTHVDALKAAKAKHEELVDG